MASAHSSRKAEGQSSLLVALWKTQDAFDHFLGFASASVFEKTDLLLMKVAFAHSILGEEVPSNLAALVSADCFCCSLALSLWC